MVSVTDLNKYFTLKNFVYLVVLFAALEMLDIFKITDYIPMGFSNLLDDYSSGDVQPSQPIGTNEANLSVDDLNLNRTPSTCYPQQALKPEDLLPSQESKAIQEFNLAQPIGEGILADVNLLDAGAHIGINTVGQSLRNANLQLRSEPPNPQLNTGPWNNSTISADMQRRPLEIGCGAQ